PARRHGDADRARARTLLVRGARLGPSPGRGAARRRDRQAPPYRSRRGDRARGRRAPRRARVHLGVRPADLDEAGALRSRVPRRAGAPPCALRGDGRLVVDLRYGAEYESFRAELRAFLAGWPLRGAEAQLPRAEQERIFRQRGIEHGYVYRSIPAL